MRKEIVKKILLIVVLVSIVFIVNIDNIFGAINTNYYNDIKSSMEVNDATTGKALENLQWFRKNKIPFIILF